MEKKELVKKNISCFFVDTVRKGIDFKHDMETERRMETEYDDGVSEHHTEKNGGFNLKKKMKKQMMMKLQQLIEYH